VLGYKIDDLLDMPVEWLLLAYENAVKISSENIAYANKVLAAFFGKSEKSDVKNIDMELKNFGIGRAKRGKRTN
jgi:hypothetical protein